MGLWRRSEVWRHLVQLKTSFFGGHRGDGNKIRVNFVARLEFQDGKRREVTQDYHGGASTRLGLR